jgi:hypothetical protein
MEAVSHPSMTVLLTGLTMAMVVNGQWPPT